MGKAAKAWNAAVEDPSKLVAEIERLKREVNASVEYHSFFRSKVDSALGQPRNGSGDIVSEIVGCIERLKKERDHWRANHDNQVKLKAAIANRPDLGDRAIHVAALAAELDQCRMLNELHAKQILETNGEIARLFDSLFSSSGYVDLVRGASSQSNATFDWSRAHSELDAIRRELFLAKRGRDSLEAELDAAPKWVPVGEFENDLKFHIVWDADEEEVFDAKMQKRSGKWFATYATERSLNVTHVLANLRPPINERTIERVATQIADGSLEAKLAEKPIEWPLPDDPRGDGDFEPKVSMSANELDAIVDGWDSDDWKVVAGDDQRIVADMKAALTTEQMAENTAKMIAVTKSADEDAIRERLMRSFLGSEAEKLGATDYKLRDGERWEWKHFQRGWADCSAPQWCEGLQYRLSSIGTAPKCVDMLGRDVVAGDAMWSINGNRLYKAETIDENYHYIVRCPRPGEKIPEFAAWRTMCLAMQDAGARFICNEYAGTNFSFDIDSDFYSRNPDCTWKL